MKPIARMIRGLAVVILAVLFAFPVHAQTTSWSNAAGGMFGENGNWTAGVPVPGDTANFALNTSYNVDINANFNFDSFQSTMGNIKFLGGGQLKINQTALIMGGEIRLQGPSTEFLVLDDIQTGFSNGGTFIIESGGAARVADNVRVGVVPNGTGLLEISGPHSMLQVEGNSSIGYSNGGSGELKIQNGGGMVSDFGLTIGLSNGSTGVGLVTGNTSELDTSGAALLVGVGGQGTLTIRNGATVVGNVGSLGTGGTGVGTATVTGPGATWNTDNSFHVGILGEGTLNLADEGSVVSPIVAIGRDAGGSGEMYLDDEGTSLQTSELYIGVAPSAGASGEGLLNLDNDADIFVGDDAPATNTGSNFFVSDTGGNALVTVGNQSSVFNRGKTFIGYNSIASGNVQLDHCSWISENDVHVGFVGDGSLTIENGSSLLVTNNRTLFVATNGAADSTLTIDDSTVAPSNFWAGTRGTATINVTNGGIITNAGWNSFIAGLGGTSTVNIDGPGSRWYAMSLYMGRAISAAGGTGQLNITNQGLMTVGNDIPIGVTDVMTVGNGGSPAEVFMAGGSQINARDLVIGYSPGNSGRLEMDEPGTAVNVSGNVDVGFLGTGELNLLGGAMVNAGGVNVNPASTINLHNSDISSFGNTNEGTINAVGGTSQIEGPFTNLAGANVTVSPGARLVFVDKVEHAGNPMVVDGEAHFLGSYGASGAITGIGHVVMEDQLQPFGVAIGQIFFAGGIDLTMESTSQTDIQVSATGFDRMTVTGDYRIDGQLDVSFVGGFVPVLGQEFQIVTVLGNQSGQFDGLPQDALVAQTGNVGLFINYQGGDGNDVRLYAGLVPDVVSPAEITIIRGTLESGDLFEISDSDNLDVAVSRTASDIQSRTEIEVAGFATSANPSHMEITVEGSVFARSPVNQIIKIYNFDTQQFEIVDTRAASRFADVSTTVVIAGNLDPYVEDITDVVVARVEYRSLNPRQQFRSNTDRISWGFAN